MKVRILYKQDKTIRIIRLANGDSAEEFDKVTPEGIEFDDIEEFNLPDVSKKRFFRGSKEEGVYIDTDIMEEEQAESIRKTELNTEFKKLNLAGKSKTDIINIVNNNDSKLILARILMYLAKDQE